MYRNTLVFGNDDNADDDDDDDDDDNDDDADGVPGMGEGAYNASFHR